MKSVGSRGLLDFPENFKNNYSEQLGNGQHSEIRYIKLLEVAPTSCLTKLLYILGFLERFLPTLIFKRFRGKINIQRPRAPHYERARVLAITTPAYPKKERYPCVELVGKEAKVNIKNPYDKIIAKEVRNWLEHSQMVGLFHINPINADDHFKARVAFHKNNMQLKQYGKQIMHQAMENSKYEELIPLFGSSTCLVFSPIHKKVGTMLKLVKKIPQMHLVCGIVDNRLLSKNEFIDYSKMPDITTARAQFVGVLNMAASQLVQNLESHQSNFVNILDAHVRENQKPEPAATEASKESTDIVEEKKP